MGGCDVGVCGGGWTTAVGGKKVVLEWERVRAGCGREGGKG